MAYLDLILTTAPVTTIAAPHRSTVAAIRRALGLGLFTAAEAELLIDRVRRHVTTFPLFLGDPLPSTVSSALPLRPDRTL